MIKPPRMQKPIPNPKHQHRPNDRRCIIHIPPRNRKTRRKAEKHRLDDRPQHTYRIRYVADYIGDFEDAFCGEIVCASMAEKEEERGNGEGDLCDYYSCAYEGVECGCRADIDYSY